MECKELFQSERGSLLLIEYSLIFSLIVIFFVPLLLSFSKLGPGHRIFPQVLLLGKSGFNNQTSFQLLDIPDR